MNVGEILATAGNSVSATRVYAEPFEKDGITVIAAAAVSGGGGGGGSTDENGQGGKGVGFGLGGKPVGAYVVQDGQVRWQPAVDVNRAITVAGLLAALSLLVGAGVVRWTRDH